MGARLGGGNYQISTSADKLAKAGHLGQKTERGFYVHTTKNGKTKKGDLDESVYRFFGGAKRRHFDAEALQQRLGLMMVNEAVRCLADGVLNTPTDGDLGAVFGLGFPPFRGGPFRYVDTVGAGVIVERLQRLEREHGPRFAPSDLLRKHHAGGTAFHST